jgi:hypothetical protein
MVRSLGRLAKLNRESRRSNLRKSRICQRNPDLQRELPLRHIRMHGPLRPQPQAPLGPGRPAGRARCSCGSRALRAELTSRTQPPGAILRGRCRRRAST